MNLCSNIAESCHILWFKIKFLNNLVKYVGQNIDLSDPNECSIEFWNLISSKVKDVLNYMANANTIVTILGNNDSYNCKCKISNEMWGHYKFLIDSLSKLLLIRNYNIIQNYDEFISDVNDILSFFENELEKNS